jgi:hypothetical protein
VVYVVAEDGESGVADIPVAVPLPLILIGIDLLKPSMRCEYISLAVAVDVGDTDAVAILLAAPQMVDTRLVLAEVDPQDAGAVVMSESDIRLAIAVDVCEGAPLRVEAVGDLLRLPHGAGRGCLGAGVAIPPETVGDPASGHEIGQAIVVDVDDPLAAVGDELIVNTDGTELMPLPLTAVGSGIFIPVGAAEQVSEAVTIHVQQRDALGVIVTEAMTEKSNTRFTAGPVAGMLQTELGGMCWVLGMAQDRGEERQSKQWEDMPEA